MRSLGDGWSIVIKKADESFSVVLRDQDDYIVETEKQLRDKNVYKDVEINKKIL